MPDHDPLCGYCHMPRSMHCKGEVVHTDGSKPQHWAVKCHTRHCLAPLCDCIDYLEKKNAAIQVQAESRTRGRGTEAA